MTDWVAYRPCGTGQILGLDTLGVYALANRTVAKEWNQVALKQAADEPGSRKKASTVMQELGCGTLLGNGKKTSYCR